MEIPIAIPLPSAPPTHQTVDLCSGQAFWACPWLAMEKEMATRSSILAWRIPWTEEPGGSSGTVHRVTKSWIRLSDFTFTFSLWLASKCLTCSCECPVVCWGPGRYREESGQREVDFTGRSQWLFKNKFSQGKVGRWPIVAGRDLVTQILRALSRCLLVMFLIISALLCWCHIFYYSVLWI